MNKTEVRGQGSGVRNTAYGMMAAVCCLLILSGCTDKEKMYKESRILMDTFCSITIVASSIAEAKEGIEAGFNEIKKLETLLNYFSPDSEITAVNRAAGITAVRVSKETLEIVQKAVDIARLSDGAFDPSIAPLIDADDSALSLRMRFASIWNGSCRPQLIMALFL